MAVKPKRPQRQTSANQDLGAIESITYNDAAGAKKFIQIEPVVVKSVGAAEAVGAGKLVKVTGAVYTLDLLNKAHDPAAEYQKGDVVTQGGFVYSCMQDQVVGAFDANKWKKEADKVVGPVAIVAGSVVPTGRWHNCVSAVGFLVEDDSEIPYVRVRD